MGLSFFVGYLFDGIRSNSGRGKHFSSVKTPQLLLLHFVTYSVLNLFTFLSSYDKIITYMFVNTFKLLSFLAFKLLIMKGSFCMPITEILERNAREFGNDVALVEVNPEIRETRRVTWKEYELIEPNPVCHYRREITWSVFNEKANRFANLLLSRGVKKGDKVGILLMNCLEWLPIYFGILKTGALAVPF